MSWKIKKLYYKKIKIIKNSKMGTYCCSNKNVINADLNMSGQNKQEDEQGSTTQP